MKEPSLLYRHLRFVIILPPTVLMLGIEMDCRIASLL
jgi:hypothetical protein